MRKTHLKNSSLYSKVSGRGDDLEQLDRQRKAGRRRLRGKTDEGRHVAKHPCSGAPSSPPPAPVGGRHLQLSITWYTVQRGGGGSADATCGRRRETGRGGKGKGTGTGTPAVTRPDATVLIGTDGRFELTVMRTPFPDDFSTSGNWRPFWVYLRR